MPPNIIHVVCIFLERMDRRYMRCLSIKPHTSQRSPMRSEPTWPDSIPTSPLPSVPPTPPQLDRPVNRARQEEIPEIDRAVQRVKVQPGDRPTVAFVDLVLLQTGFGASTVVAQRLVDVAFLRAAPERRRFVRRKVERRDRHLVRFGVCGVSKVECFLYPPKVRNQKQGKKEKDEEDRRALHEVEPTCQPANYTPSHPYYS